MVFSFNHLFIVSPSSWLLELVLWTKPSFSFKKRFGNVIFGTSGTSPYLKEGLSVRDWGTRLSYAIKLRVLSSVACHGLLEMRHGTGSIRNCLCELFAWFLQCWDSDQKSTHLFWNLFIKRSNVETCWTRCCRWYTSVLSVALLQGFNACWRRCRTAGGRGSRGRPSSWETPAAASQLGQGTRSKFRLRSGQNPNIYMGQI